MTKEEFVSKVKELAQFLEENDIRVGGCGCCGSPFIHDKTYTFVIDDFESGSWLTPCEEDVMSIRDITPKTPISEYPKESITWYEAFLKQKKEQ